MNQIAEMFAHPFMIRALIVGSLISACAALIGVPLVLKKNSMIGDGLSHVAFGAFAIALAAGIMPLWFALPVVVVASFITLQFGNSRKISGDAAIALLSASSLAIGTIAISVSSGANIDLNSYLFGSILAVSWDSVVLSVILTVVLLVFYIFSFHRIFVITFDETFAKSVGVKTEIYNIFFAAICSVVVVLGMRLLGALLISSLIIFPTVIALKLVRSFKAVVITAVIVAVCNFLIGLFLSYLMATPTGATVVVVNLVVLVIVSILNRIIK